MYYTNLVLGGALLLVFAVILVRNRKRDGLLHALFRIETVIGIVAGLYLIVTSVGSILQ